MISDDHNKTYDGAMVVYTYKINTVVYIVSQKSSMHHS